MARLCLGISLVAAVFIIAAAAQKPAFLGDNIVSSRSTTPKVKTASYGYDNTEVSCLSQLNYKNCRWTGCPVERAFVSTDWTDSTGITGGTCNNGNQCRYCWPDSMIFQTDFSCCAKERSYNSYNNRRDIDIGAAGFTDKISTCDWEISLYRSTVSTNLALGGDLGQSDPWTPVMTDDGNALKFGNAWGTCYLNAEADHCDHPLCERMAINIQGGLYGACAYSPDKNLGVATRLDTCGNSADIPGWLAAIATDRPDPTLEVTNPSRFESYLTYLRRYTCTVMANKCGYDPSKCTPAVLGIQAVKDDAVTQAQIAYDKEYSHEPEEKLFPGIALVISGPMYITGKKDQGFEETGMFEMALDFITTATDGVSDPTNRWPLVRAQGAKLRFTREEKQEEYKPREEPHYEPRHEERPHYERRQ